MTPASEKSVSRAGFDLMPGSPGLTSTGKITTPALSCLQKCSGGRAHVAELS